MQQRSPERYRPAHVVTLHRGVRKIRAQLRATTEEAWPQEVIQSNVLPSVPVDEELRRKGAGPNAGIAVLLEAEEPGEENADEDRQQWHEQQMHRLTMTIEGAIRGYVEQQREAERSRKTLEWHQMALTVLGQYLRSERGLHLVSQITAEEIEAWVECLRGLPTKTGIPREASTIGTYARSARAFCNWAKQQGYLEQTPMTRGNRATKSQLISHVLDLDDFDRLQQACGPALEKAKGRNWAAERNRALLWVFYETGMQVSDLCALRLVDVEEEQGRLWVGTGGNERWMVLSAQGWQHVSAYVKQRRFMQGAEEDGQQESLFCTEWGDPLTNNAITLLFARLKKRIGMRGRGVSPLVLRESFAVRYLQAGGEPETLRELLGLKSMAGVKYYQRLYKRLMEKDQQKECAEEDQSGPMADQAKKPRRQRRASSRTPKKMGKGTRQGASESDGSASTQREVPIQHGS
ncbi:MAG: tyrosine-type recombinase/integrase [Ktedonobacteraceae bacterium]|nr:tyrosine-type recombinase/integrase [Ktedonobacteraceae bacterium]